MSQPLRLPPIGELRIVADENIPALQALFGDLGQVRTYPGRTMTAEQLGNADVLLVRSVTQVKAELIGQSGLSFVGTCTIGTDHLDTDYLDSNGICWRAAPGCNAGGVVHYVLAALAHFMPDWQQKTFGIIGCGNVGGRLYRTLQALGLRIQVADPFKTPDDIPDLAPLASVLRADVVCCHTPLTRSGPHPTFHLLGAAELSQLKPDALLINAGRGEVIDNRALLQHLQARPEQKVVLDVWENEPALLRPLMPYLKAGTPHIAGYSVEGKLNGSLMIYAALADFLGIAETEKRQRIAAVQQQFLGPPVRLSAPDLNTGLTRSYDLPADFAQLKAAADDLPGAFDQLRKHYWQRYELSHFHGEGASDWQALTDLARKLTPTF
jgi:erythronate-4-phosphate dehydrogenase